MLPHIMQRGTRLLAFFLHQELGAEHRVAWPPGIPLWLLAAYPSPQLLSVNSTLSNVLFTFQYLWTLVQRAHHAKLSGLHEPQDTCIS